MTVRDALASVVPAVSQRDAERLLEAALSRDRTWLRTHPEAEVDAAAESVFKDNAVRKVKGEPIQYLLGEQEFFGLMLRVTPDVLIPRPETEHLVEAVLCWAARHQGPLRIVDVGAGTGAVALALASRLPDAEITATDISEAALNVARANAERLGLQRVKLLHADLLGGAAVSSLDVVVSNPPYIPAGDADTMQREVVEHEPHTALFAGVEGLDVYRKLIPQAFVALRSGGLLAMEIGFGQRDALSALLQGWQGVEFLDDYGGIPRVVLAIRA